MTTQQNIINRVSTKDLFNAIKHDLSTHFPVTEFNMKEIIESKSTFIEVSWQNDGIYVEAKLIIDGIFDKLGIFFLPVMKITPQHQILIEEKAEAMGLPFKWFQWGCAGRNSEPLHRKQFSSDDLEKANRALYEEKLNTSTSN